MSNSSQYRHFLRLKEAESVPPDEEFVQRVWFEELYQNPLMTLEGEEIRMLQPGFWNRGAGPDFSHAALINGRGEMETGSVEVHLQPLAWRQHHHEDDSFYNQVMLHVVWNAGPRGFFPRTRERASLRQVALAGQLSVPLAELRLHFQSTPLERSSGVRIGRCRRALDALPDRQVLHLLQAAGEHRFEEKRRCFALRAKALGVEQSLWLGLAEAMGYARNRDAFRGLGQRLPVRELLTHKVLEEREALLFGVAGFLPSRRLPSGTAAGHTKKLWELWWRQRARWEPLLLPRSVWNLRGIRPLNRPERRLAALALLSDPACWKHFCEGVRQADLARVQKTLAGLRHEFWSRHCTFDSRATATERSLIGPSRWAGLLFNVLGPGAALEHLPAAQEWMGQARSPLENKANHSATVRLLAGRKLGREQSRLLVQEGLIQVYQDFCLRDFEQCRPCEFPGLVGQIQGLEF